jgi:hypothetical protein
MRLARQGAGQVLTGLLNDLTRPLKNAAQLAGWGAAIAIPAVIAFVFFVLAAFVWAERTYGTLEACLLLGGAFLAVALVILIVGLILRRRAAKRAPRHNPHWWKDPAILAAGIELVRIVGVRRIIPTVALGAVIVGALEGGLDRKHKNGG